MNNTEDERLVKAFLNQVKLDQDTGDHRFLKIMIWDLIELGPPEIKTILRDYIGELEEYKEEKTQKQ